MESKSGLKDISNCNVPPPQIQGTLSNIKTMAAPKNITMEDKENYDPRTASTLITNKKMQPTEFEPVDKIPAVVQYNETENASENVMLDDSDMSSDGFDVSEGLELDEAAVSDEDSQGLSPSSHTKVQNENISKEAPAPSPLIMSSLLNSRVVFKIDDNDDEDNGASPMFPQPSVVRQERRKLDFSNLDNSPVTSNEHRKFRRCLSMVETGQKIKLNTSNSSPEMMKIGSRLNDDTASPLSRPFTSFKRPTTLPLGNSQIGNQLQPPKRLKRSESLNDSKSASNLVSLSLPKIDSPQISRPFLQMSLNSQSEANIKKACSLADEPNLTGDRSRKLILPTVPGSGSSSAKTLVNINCHTMADLVKGKYSDRVASYRIIDARYVYEFQGGHIRGAENFGTWDEEGFMKEFLPSTLGPPKIPKEDEKAHVVIFHCEFSSARGPALMSLLRNRDRELNTTHFPALHYPECYLLSEGYKQFYANYPDLCEPRGYVPMADPNFAQEERKFHKKSKSWAPGSTMSRAGSSSRLRKL